MTHTGRPQLVMQNFEVTRLRKKRSRSLPPPYQRSRFNEKYYVHIRVCICTLHWKDSEREPRWIACDGNRTYTRSRSSKCTNRLGNYKKPLLCGARRKTNLWAELRKRGKQAAGKNRKIIVRIDVVRVCVMLKGRYFTNIYLQLEKLLGKLRKPTMMRWQWMERNPFIIKRINTCHIPFL